MKNHGRPERYVILDDDCDMLQTQLDHFVRTDEHNGFGWHDYAKACQILGIKE